MKFDKLCEIVLNEANRDGEHVTVSLGQDLSALDKVPDSFFVKVFYNLPRVRLPINREVAKTIMDKLENTLPKMETATRKDAVEFSKSSVVGMIIDWLKEVPEIANIEEAALDKIKRDKLKRDAQFKIKKPAVDEVEMKYINALNARFKDAADKILIMLNKTRFVGFPKLKDLSDARGGVAGAADIPDSAIPTKRRGRPAGAPKIQTPPEMVQYEFIMPGEIINLNKIPEQQLRLINKSLTKSMVSHVVKKAMFAQLGKGKDKADVISNLAIGLHTPIQNDSDSFQVISISDVYRKVATPLIELLISKGILESETRERPAPKKYIPKADRGSMGKIDADIIKDVVNNARYGGSGEINAANQASISADYQGAQNEI